MSIPKVLLVGLFTLLYGGVLGYWLGALVHMCRYQ